MIWAAVVLLPMALAGIAPPAKHAFGFDAKALQDAKYHTQVQDHNDSNNTNTWQQAYYVNDHHWDGSKSSPVFIYIGGEGPLGPSGSVVSNFVTDVLGKYNGLLLALEHRYYGCHNASSCPYDVVSPEPDHLRFCTSQQALADLATFHAYATTKYHISPGARWVSIGGSYPGMLAGFVRAVYPDLIHAAVASSAPIRGVLDMPGFQDVVTSAYGMTVEGIEGSKECVEQIRSGHAAVAKELLTAAGRHHLAFLFNSTVESAAWLEAPTNQRTFAGCGVASFPAQANQPSCHGPGCGITQICDIMTDPASGPTPMARLATLAEAQWQAGVRVTAACEMDWEMPGGIPPKDENYWGYQTCNEFGFYQTCEEGTDCFYTQGLVSFANKDHQPNDFCQAQFGLSSADTVERIAATNQYYEDKLATATRIVWVNGDVDPWHAQGVLQAPSAHQPVIFPVKGAAHCAWMRAASDGEQQSLKAARASIWQQLDRWLAEA